MKPYTFFGKNTKKENERKMTKYGLLKKCCCVKIFKKIELIIASLHNICYSIVCMFWL